MAKTTKAVLIIWLNEMKEKGRQRIKTLGKQYAAGSITLYDLQQAQAKQAAIKELLSMLSDCQIELHELHELLKGMKKKKQQNLFSPKNPN
jgi:outer membrane protein TolC